MVLGLGAKIQRERVLVSRQTELKLVYRLSVKYRWQYRSVINLLANPMPTRALRPCIIGVCVAAVFVAGTFVCAVICGIRIGIHAFYGLAAFHAPRPAMPEVQVLITPR